MRVHASTASFIIHGNGNSDIANERMHLNIHLGSQNGFNLSIEMMFRPYDGMPVGGYCSVTSHSHDMNWIIISYKTDGYNTTYLIQNIYGGWGSGILTYPPIYSGFYISNEGYNITSLDGANTLYYKQQIYYPWHGESLPEGTVAGGLFFLKST